MEACVSTSRVLLPFPLCAARPADACFQRRAGASRRRGVGLNPATASLDSAVVLLDATVGAGTGYSLARYYTSLAFFVLSVPGLWLLIKRSVKSKGSGMRLNGLERNLMPGTEDALMKDSPKASSLEVEKPSLGDGEGPMLAGKKRKDVPGRENGGVAKGCSGRTP
ncbi:hypothetical protein ACQJBY_015132 [Aegilops geniculata]